MATLLIPKHEFILFILSIARDINLSFYFNLTYSSIHVLPRINLVASDSLPGPLLLAMGI